MISYIEKTTFFTTNRYAPNIAFAIQCDENGVFLNGFCIKNHEFCIQNDEFCFQNGEFCIQNDEFCIQNDEMRIKYKGLTEASPVRILHSEKSSFWQ